MLLYRNQWGICNLIKKLLPIILIILLVLSGINFTTISADKKIVKKSVTKLAFSKPTLVENKEYISVSMEETDSFLMETGKPMMPKSVKIFELEFGARNINVEVTTGNIREYEIEKEIRPAPVPMPLATIRKRAIMKNKAVENLKKEDAVYSSKKLFPSDWYNYNVGVGLNAAGKRVTHVAVHVFPARYAPAMDRLYVAENVDIKVTYEESETTSFFENGGNGYDLMIIAPEDFSRKLQLLINHKNNHGVKAFLKTTEEIYAEFYGRDKPEQIKYAIRDAIETRNVKYVLLVGGRKGQTFDWHIPERVTNNDDGWEGGYASDLYYADVYRYNETTNKIEFEDWDSNGNDIFAEWGMFASKKDKMDYYPDVYVGRLACRSKREVETVVDKIINYENTADDSWFKKAIVISGDTFPPQRGGQPGWYEGEMETGITADLLEGIGFDIEKLWLSIPGVWTGREDVVNAITRGAGFIHFAGHGNPASWGNHPPDDSKGDDLHFVEGLALRDMPNLDNGYHLPVMIVGGCHNSQFNVTLLNIIKGILKDKLKYFDDKDGRFWYMEWVPECWSWSLVRQKNGGAIATIGNTGLGYGYVNEGATEGLGGWIEPRFFDAYANQSIDVLGEAHAQAITDYINIIGGVNSDQIDRKTIEEWVLLGDPSLKIGGYLN